MQTSADAHALRARLLKYSLAKQQRPKISSYEPPFGMRPLQTTTSLRRIALGAAICPPPFMP
eukprot:361510-Pyramimonas_sp.AAC.1